MRFVCDSTVGKLARLLRMAGIDTAYVKKESLPLVLSISLEENRKILSRNSKFNELTLAIDYCHLEMDDPYDQLKYVVRSFGLELEARLFLSRCLECNEPLAAIEKGLVVERLYPFVAKTQEQIFHCLRCNKLYWHATHARAIVKRLNEISDEPGRGSADFDG